MAKKYLLSDGTTTSKVEYYIIDLFKLYLVIYPKDIPGASSIGFDFTLTNVKKSNLSSTVTNKINSLVTKIAAKFSGVTIEVNSIDIVDEKTVNLVIDVNKVTSDTIEVDIS